MPFGIGGGELVIIAIAAFVLFGAGSLPKFARGIGDALREFKKAGRELREPLDDAKAEARAIDRTLNRP